MRSPCHACAALRHWCILTSQNAHRYRLTGTLGDHAQRAVADAIDDYAHAGAHTCPGGSHG